MVQADELDEGILLSLGKGTDPKLLDMIRDYLKTLGYVNYRIDRESRFAIDLCYRVPNLDSFSEFPSDFDEDLMNFLESPFSSEDPNSGEYLLATELP